MKSMQLANIFYVKWRQKLCENVTSKKTQVGYRNKFGKAQRLGIHTLEKRNLQEEETPPYKCIQMLHLCSQYPSLKGVQQAGVEANLGIGCSLTECTGVQDHKRSLYTVFMSINIACTAKTKDVFWEFYSSLSYYSQVEMSK